LTASPQKLLKVRYKTGLYAAQWAFSRRSPRDLTEAPVNLRQDERIIFNLGSTRVPPRILHGKSQEQRITSSGSIMAAGS
jgi:hypothetical protein